LFNNMGPKERLAYVVLVAAGLCVAGYVGEGYLHKPPDIVIQPAAKAAPAPTTEQTSTSQSDVVVDVTGCVAKPGVYHFPPDARVEDAVARAGGATGDADLPKINRAAKLVDGTQVRIPSKKDAAASPPIDSAYDPNPAPSAGRRSGSSSRGTKAEPAPQSVSLNSADSEALQALPGVGPATAERILDYRKSHGKFKSIDELTAVGGIGPKKLEKMRKYIRL
jgi:competence protein ComEA